MSTQKIVNPTPLDELRALLPDETLDHSCRSRVLLARVIARIAELEGASREQ